MVVISGKSKKILYRVSYIGVFFAVVWGGLMTYLGTYAPTVSDEAAGRVYAYNYHGTIVYLNLMEQVLRFAIPGVGFLAFFILMIVERYLKKKDTQWPPDDIYGN